MGLTLGVGWLARAAREDDLEDFAFFRQPYDALNMILAEAGLPPHDEPLDIPEDHLFEAQMWGYGGLHAIRRLAAYWAIERRLPPPGARYEDFSKDPMTERLNQMLLQWDDGRQKKGVFSRIFQSRNEKPAFQHLLWHSDAEGFYLPRPFDDVLFDTAAVQRDGVGGMIGSAVKLREECLILAEAIALPLDLDIESDELVEAAENPASSGKPWQIYGIEAFGLARLISATEQALLLNAALIFQ
ncbi:MAG: hypothetical protein JWN66_3867 [Sphingomonas bacterium]|uniref:hypothetical protein n=1 Tax=Sphingomonas bacterium TaxID=1895847 RepID=UPI002638D28C|nr:hypothetical protein [Sphingomonas bacterium]MDB5706751.1 hypothetical protein [Sphingomonas bacterium]